jgi:hypothetical protein
MQYPIGSHWRVVARDATLESAHGQMHPGGALSTSFQRHQIPVGTILIGAGTRNVGSDSFTEDVFCTETGIRGAFSPRICGSAIPQALAPLTRACAITRKGSRYGIEIGPILDKIPSQDIAGCVDPKQLRDLIAARFTTAEIISTCGTRLIRPRWKLQIEIDATTMRAYIDWREHVAHITQRTGERVAILLAELGGRAIQGTTPGYFSHPRQTIFSRDAEMAVAAATALFEGTDLVLTEGGKQYAEGIRTAGADRVLLALLEQHEFAQDGYAPRSSRFDPLCRVVGQDDVRHAVGLGLAEIPHGLVAMTAAGRERADWLSFTYEI